MVPGRFYRSDDDEVWCCFVAYEKNSFGVVRLRDSATAQVNERGKGVSVTLLAQTFKESCRTCGALG